MNEQQIKEMMLMMFKIIGSDEYAEAITGAVFKIYLGLVDKGFSGDQAMELTKVFVSTLKSTSN